MIENYSYAGVHVPGPIIRLHTNVAYVTNKPVRYVVTIILLLWLEVNNELVNSIVKKVRRRIQNVCSITQWVLLILNCTI